MNVLDKIIRDFQDDNVKFLKADGLDDAVIGFEVHTNKLIYSMNKCVTILRKRDGMSIGEAIEFFDINVVGAYVGELTPIFIYDDFE